MLSGTLAPQLQPESSMSYMYRCISCRVSPFCGKPYVGGQRDWRHVYTPLQKSNFCCHNVHVAMHVCCVMYMYMYQLLWSTAAFEYLKSHPVGDVDEQELSQYCGVGVVISPDQIEEQVHFNKL